MVDWLVAWMLYNPSQSTNTFNSNCFSKKLKWQQQQQQQKSHKIKWTQANQSKANKKRVNPPSTKRLPVLISFAVLYGWVIMTPLSLSLFVCDWVRKGRKVVLVKTLTSRKIKDKYISCEVEVIKKLDLHMKVHWNDNLIKKKKKRNQASGYLFICFSFKRVICIKI